MKTELAPLNPDIEAALCPEKNDRSGVGVHYTDAFIKPLKKRIELPDGTKFSVKRRGLKITVAMGTNKGEGLLRRLENGPDPKNMFQCALDEASEQIGVKLHVEDGKIWLEHEPAS